MALADDADLIERFEEFYRNYYRNDIGQLAQKYPNEQRSLYVDWNDLYRYDPDMAEDMVAKPGQMLEYAEEALRLYDLPVDVKLGNAHVRVENLGQATGIRDIRADHVGNLVAVQGIIRKATDVRPKMVEAAFECQRCGTLTRIPQSGSDFQEPHECQGCERQGPFKINFDQSEFVDSQKIRVQESPEGLRGGETPQAIDVNIEDDVTGRVTAGDHVTATGILHLDQQGTQQEKSSIFDFYMEGLSVQIEDEQFEEMDITGEDEKRIVDLSSDPEIYEKMVGSMAPSIFGYETEKLSIIMQLFSGVRKSLPDGSRIRGDIHILLIGDPGTGKSQILQYVKKLAPRSVYTSGKGSSSAGLTAAAVRDDFGEGQQWTLEAGALVLADQGVAAVDELDKMRCVTGDTLVHLADGRIERIGEIAREAAESGTIEPLSNGRTIRDVNYSVWTMDEDDRLVCRPVTAVHEYDAPDELAEVRLESGNTLQSTVDHPYFVSVDGERTEKPAGKLEPGDQVYVPALEWSTAADTAADGGVVIRSDDTASDSRPDVTLETVDTVDRIDNDGHEQVYDLTVEGTHNFVANGMVVHNSEDQSAMHQALEQQEISVSKAGINATLKSRCSLLGAANPTYGRFDEYEPVGEQIDLEPPLISRFDLIFTVTDKPDAEKDRDLAEHIIKTNYAGELNTHRTSVSTSNVTQQEVDNVTEEVVPVIEADLLRKYVAYAKRNCYPTMTEEAKTAIRDFYVDMRTGGSDDSAVPVTARKLEALVRLAEASARIRLSDRVTTEDTNRVIEIVRSSLEDVGMDPETGEFDADMVEAGTSKSQRDRIKNVKGIIRELQEEYEDGAPFEQVLERAEQAGIEASKVEHEIQKLKDRGDIYEPKTDHLRVV